MSPNHHTQQDRLSDALRQMPVPPPRPGFVDQVLALAVTDARESRARRSTHAFARWETWMGAVIGAAVAMMATLLVMRPQVPVAPEAAITLAINEARNVDVLIDSERALEGATIRVATTGAVELDGFDDKRVVQWQTRLERGRNVLSLPVVARASGAAQLVAIIEHEGRTRKVAINLLVNQSRRDGVA